MEKPCAGCFRVLDESEFYANGSRQSKKSRCRSCEAEANQEPRRLAQIRKARRKYASKNRKRHWLAYGVSMNWAFVDVCCGVVMRREDATAEKSEVTCQRCLSAIHKRRATCVPSSPSSQVLLSELRAQEQYQLEQTTRQSQQS